MDTQKIILDLTREEFIAVMTALGSMPPVQIEKDAINVYGEKVNLSTPFFLYTRFYSKWKESK